jgi:hypothetical protein
MVGVGRKQPRRDAADAGYSPRQRHQCDRGQANQRAADQGSDGCKGGRGHRAKSRAMLFFRIKLSADHLERKGKTINAGSGRSFGRPLGYAGQAFLRAASGRAMVNARLILPLKLHSRANRIFQSLR